MKITASALAFSALVGLASAQQNGLNSFISDITSVGGDITSVGGGSESTHHADMTSAHADVYHSTVASTVTSGGAGVINSEE